MVRIAYVEIADEPRVQCVVPDGLAINEGDECVIDANRLLEYGRIAAIEDVASDHGDRKTRPVVLRRSTLQDQAQSRESELRSRMAMDTCSSKAEQLKMAIRLIKVRFSFDRSVLRVVFGAEERVDCRELIRQLGEELRTRVEVRQVGVRDEAGMKGGMAPCGRLLCCASWLHNFESINVKMAKAQQLSLSPGTISGMCGRLRCCLRFEHDCYRELARKLPREGTSIRCRDGDGIVIAREILAQRVRVRLSDDRVLAYAVDDIEVLQEGAPPPRRRRRQSQHTGRAT